MPDTLIYMPTNNCARIMLFLKLNGLEDKFSVKSPKDFGGLQSPDFLKINPQGKFPALITEGGLTLYESQVILEYIADVYEKDLKVSCRASTPEARAVAALLNRVHDVYVASANSTAPGYIAQQGVMYKASVPVAQRSAMTQDLKKQLDELERLMDASGPWAAGQDLTFADLSMFPTYIFISEMAPISLGWSDMFETRPKSRAWFRECERNVTFSTVAKDIREWIGAVMIETKRLEEIKQDIDTNGKDLPW